MGVRALSRSRALALSRFRLNHQAGSVAGDITRGRHPPHPSPPFPALLLTLPNSPNSLPVAEEAECKNLQNPPHVLKNPFANNVYDTPRIWLTVSGGSVPLGEKTIIRFLRHCRKVHLPAGVGTKRSSAQGVPSDNVVETLLWFFHLVAHSPRKQ